MGWGDVTPLTPAASMIRMMTAIAGTISIVAVMGVWISRFRVQEAEEWRRS